MIGWVKKNKFRTFVVILILLIGSLIFFKKIKAINIFWLTLSFLIVGYLANGIMNTHLGYSYLDRITLESETRDVNPINFRSDQFGNAIQMSKNSLFGVGLGNYYDQLPGITKHRFLIANKSQQIAQQGAQEFVHNVFGAILAESGLISVLVFLILIILFAKNDLLIIKQADQVQKALVIAFWSLFSYGLFNPVLPASYQVIFWGLRGLLMK